MSPIVIAVLLLIVGIIVFAIDLMIPTGGVLIAVTALFGIASVTVAFRHSPSTGVMMLIITSLAIPVMLFTFLKLFPKSPIGRRLISKPESQGTFVWADASKFGDSDQLVGQIGEAISEFLPSGRVRLGDQTFEGFSETGPIEIGSPVQVVRIDIGRLVVKLYREHTHSDQPMSAGSGLDRPVSELDLDSIQ